MSDDWIQRRLQDPALVAQAHQRLRSLSWFMKCLKELLSRMVNRQEETRGTCFEERFKGIAILVDRCGVWLGGR